MTSFYGQVAGFNRVETHWREYDWSLSILKAAVTCDFYDGTCLFSLRAQRYIPDFFATFVNDIPTPTNPTVDITADPGPALP